MFEGFKRYILGEERTVEEALREANKEYVDCKEEQVRTLLDGMRPGNRVF